MNRNKLLFGLIILTIILSGVYSYKYYGDWWLALISLLINMLVAAIFYLLGKTTLSERIGQDYVITLKYNIIPDLNAQIKKYKIEFRKNPMPLLSYQKHWNGNDVKYKDVLQNDQFIFTPIDIWSHNLYKQIKIDEINPKDVLKVRDILQKLYNTFRKPLLYAKADARNAKKFGKINGINTITKGSYYDFSYIKALLNILKNK